MSIRTIARTLLAGIFLVGGWDSLQNPKARTEPAKEVRPIAEKMGLPSDPVQLVKINGAAQLGGAVMLMAGWMPRLAALILGVTLVPTTLSTHRFWEIREPDQRRAQMMHALKNGSILGGLIMTALDHGGRPSVFWSTRKAAERAGSAVSKSGSAVSKSVNKVAS